MKRLSDTTENQRTDFPGGSYGAKLLNPVFTLLNNEPGRTAIQRGPGERKKMVDMSNNNSSNTDIENNNKITTEIETLRNSSFP